MDHSETDIVACSFVASTRVTDESRELDDGEIAGVGIFNHGSDDTATSESPTCRPAGEYFGGVTDGIGTDGAEAGATEEGHRRPPIDSMRATRTITSAKARMARGPWYLLGIFMM